MLLADAAAVVARRRVLIGRVDDAWDVTLRRYNMEDGLRVNWTV